MSGLYKTVLCHNFASSGACDLGADCGFAHGIKELRSLENPMYKIQLCPAYEQIGDCQQGACCLFAHGNEELRDNDLPPVSKSTFVESTSYVADPKKENFKTALCMHFAKSQNCPKGDSCAFAHGNHELRVQNMSNANDPKYKTKLCIRFEQNQFCGAGESCGFAHGEAELKLVPSNQEGRSGVYKTTLCNNFAQLGVCPSGTHCNFAHGKYELRPMNFQGDFDQKVKDNPRWKCVPCSHFQQNGFCSRESCDYAHGDGELRSIKPDTPGPKTVKSNYKTTLCNHWERQGSCLTGDACNFAHGSEDLRIFGGTSLMVLPSHQRSSVSLKRPAAPIPQKDFQPQMPAKTGSLDPELFNEFLEFKKFKEAATAVNQRGSQVGNQSTQSHDRQAVFVNSQYDNSSSELFPPQVSVPVQGQRGVNPRMNYQNQQESLYSNDVQPGSSSMTMNSNFNGRSRMF